MTSRLVRRTAGSCPKKRAIKIWPLLAALAALLLMGRSAPAATASIEPDSIGWYEKVSNFQYSFANSGNYIAGQSSSSIYHDFFHFQLSSVSGTITAATLNLSQPAQGYFSLDTSETYALYDVSTSTSDLESGVNPSNTFADLGTGNALGTITLGASSIGTVVHITLNGTGLNYLNSHTASGEASFGGAVTTVSGSYDQTIFSFSGESPDQVSLTLTTQLPEPTAVSLLGTVMAVMGLRRRRAIMPRL